MQGIQSTEAPRTASAIAARASELVGGDRDRQHGKKRDNFENIAAVWNAYLNIRRGDELDGTDVGHMMALMKIARTQSGSLNIDDYVDGAGYMACAGEVAQDYDDADREFQAAIEGAGLNQDLPTIEWRNPLFTWRVLPEFEAGDRVRQVHNGVMATVVEVRFDGWLRVHYDIAPRPASIFHEPERFERVQ